MSNRKSTAKAERTSLHRSSENSHHGPHPRHPDCIEGDGAVTISVVNSEAARAGGKPLTLILARELASNLATPMTLIDARGILVFYNDAAAQLIGKPFGEMGEIPAEEFGAVLRMKTPDGQILLRRDSPSGISFMERRPAHRTLYATGFDGVERLVHATAYPLFGTNGEMHGVVSVFWQVGDQEDVT